MQCTAVRLSLALSVLALAACSSSGGTDASINKPRDSGFANEDTGEPPVDSGMQGNPDAGSGNPDAMGGNPDAMGGNPDATAAGCNPVDGTGCMAPNQCIAAPSGNMVTPACRQEANPTIAFEQNCSVPTANCQHGYACLQFQGEMGMPSCRKVCRNGNDGDCAGLVGTSTSYACLLPFSQDYGLCMARPHSCVPYNDNCPAMQYCQSLTQSTTGCIPEGTANVGDACGASSACKKGGICIRLQGDATSKCYKPCDPNGANTCGMNSACAGFQGISWGACVASVACTPLMDNCPAMQACAPISATSFACAPEGGQPGQSCPSGTCTKGYICAGASAMAATCLKACDATHACPNMGMCQMLMGSTIGVCP
jgi:hypothetical protein